MFWALLERTKEYRRELCWLALALLAFIMLGVLCIAGKGGLEKLFRIYNS